MGFSKGNLFSFPKGMPDTGTAEDSSALFLTTAAQHSTASPAPCLPPSTLSYRIRAFFPRASFLSRSSPALQSLILPEQGKRSLQSPSKKMIASASGFQRDVLLPTRCFTSNKMFYGSFLQTDYIYSSLGGWGLGGKKLRRRPLLA